MTKKLVGTFIIIAMLLPYTVCIAENDISLFSGKPQPSWCDEFDAEQTVGDYTSLLKNGIIEDGFLKANCNSTNIGSGYYKADKTIIAGESSVEMKLKRSTSSAVSVFRFYGDGGKIAALINWDGNGTIGVRGSSYTKLQNSDNTQKLPYGDFSVEMEMKIDFHYAIKKFDLYINGASAGEFDFYQTGSDTGILYFMILPATANPSDSIWIDCVKATSLEKIPEPNVDEDAEALLKEDLLKVPLYDGKLADSLTLPVKGKTGCDIAWESNNTDIIDNTGNVKIPDKDTEVKLTATFSYEENQKQKDFYFTVTSDAVKQEGMSKIIKTVYEDNFDDSKVNEAYLWPQPANGTIEEKNGTLSIIKSGVTGLDKFYVFPNGRQGKGFYGNYLTEFVLSRKANENVGVRLHDGGNVSATVNRNADTIDILIADEKGGASVKHTVDPKDFNVTDSMKISFLTSSKEQTITVLINNIAAAKGYLVSGYDKFSRVLVLCNDAACNISADDFKVYQLKENDEDAVAHEISELEAFIKKGEYADGILYKSMELPKYGSYGCDIEWTTSDSDILSSDGLLSLPSDEEYSEDPEITISASVTSGEVTDTRKFIYKVMRSGIGERTVIDNDLEEVTYESLLTDIEKLDGYISHNLNLPHSGKKGSLFVWESSQNDMLSNKGELLKRPSNPIEAKQITLTVKASFGSQEKTKMFLFKILPDGVDITTKKPKVYSTIYSDDFSDGSAFSERWLLRPFTEGVADAVDGRFQLTRTNSINELTYANVYLDKKKQPVEKGIVVFEYTAEKVGKGECRFDFVYGSSTPGTYLYWNEDNTFSYHYRESRDGSIKIKKGDKAYKGEVKITCMFNARRGVYTIWINDDVLGEEFIGRYYSTYISYMRAALEKENYITVYLDDIRLYTAIPEEYEKPFFDAELITDISLLNAPYLVGNCIDTDLNLMTKGEYGSDIMWESSMPDIIDESGKVTRPVDMDENPEVTLTATVSVPSGFKIEKSFKFTVMSEFSSEESYVDADLKLLTFENYNMFSFDDSSLDEIRTFINIPSKLAFGSQVCWSSSDQSTLTNNGRVIRGRWDEQPKHVTLTATLTYGSCTKTKSFDITVLPDERIEDPQYMTDEAFFGKWNGMTWEIKGKFNYDANPKMSGVESAVKRGDYQKAKDELLKYMKSRQSNMLIDSAMSRNPSVVNNVVMNDIWTYVPTRSYVGKIKVENHEYEKIRIPIIAKKFTSTRNDYAFDIQSTYNENSSISIITKEYGDKDFAPQLEISAGGKKTVYYADADTMVRGGDYKNEVYGKATEITSMMKGEVNGSDNCLPIIKFKFSIPDGVTADEVTLVLTAKVNEPNIESKDIVVLEEINTLWDENELTRASFGSSYSSTQGQPHGNDWLMVVNGYDAEYENITRFETWPNMAAEYSYTGDEKYAYKMIQTMMDFVRDTQYPMSCNEFWKYNGTSYYEIKFCAWDVTREKGYDSIHYGGMPNPLSAAFRMLRWMTVFDTLLQSRYMTADACTTFLKDMWNTCTEGSLLITEFEAPMAKQRPNNIALYQGNYYTRIGLFMPEFEASSDWISAAIELYKNMADGGYYSDGAYGESTSGYTSSVLSLYMSYMDVLAKAGMTDVFGDEYNEFLYNAVIYAELLKKDAGGIRMAWGDDEYSKELGRAFPEYEDINKDSAYMFLDTRGKEGEAPDWTSKHYNGNMTTIMRSNWTSNALHAFTNCDGIGSGHGHQDANHLRISAFGELLLCDPGNASYNLDDFRTWTKSTRAHNTVEVDNVTQGTSSTGGEILGTLNEWSTNNQFDVISQTSKAYNIDEDSVGVNHQRTITFLKSGFWIVNDRLIPNDNETPHDYKQMWHMYKKLADTMTIDDKNGSIKSDVIGPNVILSSPDGNAIEEEDGWFVATWGTYAPSRQAYYKIDNKKGVAAFNTAILPYAVKGQGDLKTEKIPLDVTDDIATAMKVKTTVSGIKSETSYMLNYEPEAGKEKTFGEYAGDGFVNAVRVTENGKIAELILDRGTLLKSGADILLKADTASTANIGVSVVGTTANILTNDCDIMPQQLYIKLDSNIENVSLNGKNIKFTQKNGVLELTNTEAEEKVQNDSAGGASGFGYEKGGSTGESSSGGTASGGNFSGDIQKEKFNDISGHWAKEYITKAADKGIAKGDENGAFRPDALVSRAEAVTMAVRLLSLDTSNDGKTVFADVDAASWYAPYVKAAADNNIISEDSVFRPDDSITREEMCKILTNVASAYTGENIVIPDEYELLFADATDIAPWADEFVKAAVYSKLMNGVDENNFKPKANATRAQYATVIARILEK